MSGKVAPSHPGKKVAVSLYRKNAKGNFFKLDNTTATLSKWSRYSATFRRPRSGSCRVKSMFLGDEEHRRSAVVRSFRCQSLDRSLAVKVKNEQR